MEDIKRFSLRIDKDIHEDIRKYSYLTGISMNDIITKIVEEWLEKEDVKKLIKGDVKK